MKTWMLVAVLSVMTAGFLGGCAYKGTEPSRYTMSRADEALADLVLQRLQNDSITRRYRVGVDVSDGAVILRGNNPGAEARERIYSIVRGTAGVRSVEDSFIGF